MPYTNIDSIFGGNQNGHVFTNKTQFKKPRNSAGNCFFNNTIDYRYPMSWVNNFFMTRKLCHRATLSKRSSLSQEVAFTLKISLPQNHNFFKYYLAVKMRLK